MKTKNAGKIGSGTRRDYVYQYLFENIIDCQLQPGSALSENEIASNLHVSRTPVREAMIQLSRQGLVEIVPQIGTFVSLIDPPLVEESRFMRLNLEMAVIRIAAAQLSEDTLLLLERSLIRQRKSVGDGDYKAFFQLDDEFHETIFKGLGKKKTWQAIDQMNAQFKRVRVLRLVASSPSRWEETLDDHERLVNVLRKKDADEAEKVIGSHLGKCLWHIDELKQKYPHYFQH
ncbi:hypothetical protein WQ57_13840 [Mesobacillus campisalis]|uniref:HTH gntR-type domain-containing protein n=1 Tax=Mesobacillus campisalis TaxID=1408103 RepID=A0A0M2SUY6_9BACI|nr:GntR family transcriptional regulator [Mesobacillus campisalis]KKK37516.1 hypothetical protein WQ57_13840 [Mesobacillus campisalis]